MEDEPDVTPLDDQDPTEAASVAVCDPDFYPEIVDG
jgi:hypothetical protein